MSDTMKEDDMTIRNKAALIGASVITASALLLASPALAHKGHSRESDRQTSKSVVATPTAAPTYSPSATPTASPTKSPKAPKLGDKHGHGKGHEGKGKKKAPKFVTQTVTVDVPETGTYQLLVTKVKPVKATPTPTASPAPTALPAHPEHSFTVAVTGTGLQTITLKLPKPGNYTVSLVSVVSTQSITATK
jgi:hypothetical protein